ncbi:MAG: insulinase family protein [Deltaproteobacteria bacterium]|nr:insulinase family protein [Deltaproteobacteria bacterium]
MQREITQQKVAGAIDFLAEPMPGFHTATFMMRIEGGLCSEPADQLGLAYVIEQALDKGTARRSARELADAFDAVGAQMAVYTGRQGWVLVGSSLPEHLTTAIELIGEVVCEPAFPEEVVQTAVALTLQELSGLEDSPRGLLRRKMTQQVYGPILGRHMLGDEESLARVDAARVREHFARLATRSAMTMAVAGKIDIPQIRESVEQAFGALPEGERIREEITPHFPAAKGHITKDLEQTQIGISFPGVGYADPSFATEQVMLGVLSGGMSARLFAEVREKLGLVYWVGAWHEQPRGLGVVHVGAATKPERCAKTYETLLREIARLSEDLTEEELERAKTGIVAESTTSGVSVQQRANDLMVDHFHLGRAVRAEEKLDEIRRVTVDDIRGYLKEHPRDSLSVVTVGPAPLGED